MASGGGGCSASERLPPPFPGLEPESEGAAGGSEPEAGDSDTEGEDIFTGAAAAVSSLLLGRPGGGRVPQRGRKSQRGSGRLGRVGPARPCVGDSNRGLGLLAERGDAGPGFPAPGRTARSEGCGGFSAESLTARSRRGRRLASPCSDHGLTELFCWSFLAGLIS